MRKSRVCCKLAQKKNLGEESHVFTFFPIIYIYFCPLHCDLASVMVKVVTSAG